MINDDFKYINEIDRIINLSDFYIIDYLNILVF